MLEILVNYSVLPSNFVLTPIAVPDFVTIKDVPQSTLTEGWDSPVPTPATQEYGRLWAESKASVVLRVPSAVIKTDANYVINLLHPEYPLLKFGAPEPFHFDHRLK